MLMSEEGVYDQSTRRRAVSTSQGHPVDKKHATLAGIGGSALSHFIKLQHRSGSHHLWLSCSSSDGAREEIFSVGFDSPRMSCLERVS